MRCPDCGKEFEEGTRVCPWCGAAVPQVFVQSRRPAARAATIGILAVALVAVLAISMIGDGDRIEKGIDPADDVTEFHPDYNYSVQGVFATGDEVLDFDVAPVEISDEGVSISVTLSDKAASGYDRFDWFVHCDTDRFYRFESVRTETPSLLWELGDSPLGSYTVGVVCSNSKSGILTFPWDRPEYTVSVNIVGTVSKTFEWTYKDCTHTIELEFPYDEYSSYSGVSVADLDKRAAYGNDFSVVSDFMTVNETVEDLERMLASEYRSSFKTSASGQDYAEFLLAFVQECFDYQSDSITYGRSEYFAYPMETIFNGSGDCEDTSILLASLYLSAGYDSGVFFVPGHAFVAVSLNDYAPSTVPSGYAVSVFSFETEAGTYYGCETTTDGHVYGIGWISDDYSIDADGVVHCKDESYTKGYGLFLP